MAVSINRGDLVANISIFSGKDRNYFINIKDMNPG